MATEESHHLRQNSLTPVCEPIADNVNIVVIDGVTWLRKRRAQQVARYGVALGLGLGFAAGLLSMGLSVYFFGGEG